MARIKTGGRGPGTPNRLTSEIREALGVVLGNEIESLPDFLSKLEPKERLDVVVKLFEFVLPRMKDLHTTMEEPEPEKEKSRFDINLLTKEEREHWYLLYDKACEYKAFAVSPANEKSSSNG